MGVTEVFCITVVGGIFCVSVIHAEGNCLILFVTDTHKVGHDPTPPLVCMFVLVWLGPNITVFTFIVLCCGVFSATVILYVFLWVSTSAEHTVLYLRSWASIIVSLHHTYGNDQLPKSTPSNFSDNNPADSNDSGRTTLGSTSHHLNTSNLKLV